MTTKPKDRLPGMARSYSGPPVLLWNSDSECPVSVVAAGVASTQSRDTTQRFATGWGASPAEATRKCLWEAAERFSAQVFGDEEIKQSSAGFLDDAAVLPTEILLISEEQYSGRQVWNSQHGGFNELPRRWKSDQPIDWVRASSSLGSSNSWLPAGLCFLGHSRDRQMGLPPADSNGVAAGKTVKDAVVRAFVELVERDAVAIWWYNRMIRPQLDPDHMDEPLVAAYATWSRTRGRLLRLHDLTHDLQIPVVVGITHDDDGGFVAFGFGAGSTIATAARHAVGELAQFESNIAMIEEHIAVVGERGLTPDAHALLQWWRTTNIAEHVQLGSGDMTAQYPDDIRLTLEGCRELCGRFGLRFFALDLTRSNVGVPVARVVVPGLRPMWARFAPGRLFDVPLRMGWLSAPRAQSALNPTPLMF